MKVEFKITIHNHELLPNIRTLEDLKDTSMLKGDILVLNYAFTSPSIEPDLLSNLSTISSILEDNTTSLEFNKEEYDKYTYFRDLIDKLSQNFQKLDNLVVKKWNDDEVFRNSMVNNLSTPGYELNSIDKAFVVCELEKTQ